MSGGLLDLNNVEPISAGRGDVTERVDISTQTCAVWIFWVRFRKGQNYTLGGETCQ
ncbi:uncharacterized protein METZ01_LOCUS115444, partial [marine metagenome]